MSLRKFHELEDDRARGYVNGRAIEQVRSGWSGTVYDGVWGVWLVGEHNEYLPLDPDTLIDVDDPDEIEDDELGDTRPVTQPVADLAPTPEEIINLMLEYELVETANPLHLTEGGRWVAEDLIRTFKELYLEYMRLLRRSDPDMAKTSILIMCVDQALRSKAVTA